MAPCMGRASFYRENAIPSIGGAATPLNFSTDGSTSMIDGIRVLLSFTDEKKIPSTSRGSTEQWSPLHTSVLSSKRFSVGTPREDCQETRKPSVFRTKRSGIRFGSYFLYASSRRRTRESAFSPFLASVSVRRRAMSSD